ncbi:hypothetical protein BGX20_005590 [Mortierella sp. AD010]|nr:hypothetical protein BGX20_005590 [Mortierella sp. AD010]
MAKVQSVPAIMMPNSSSPSSNIHTNVSTIRPLSVKSAKTGSAPLAISPENDPYPSWTFFPPTATYIPPSSDNTTSPLSSPTATTAPSSPTPRRASPPLAPNTTNTLRNQNVNVNNINSNNNNIPTSTPSTHHRILDHCFHLSIETRLKQAEAQYLASIQEQAVEQQIKEQEESHQAPMSALHQDDWRRRQRTLVDEAVVLGRKGSNVEAIVDGILKSHRSSGPLQNLPRHLKHRLHLCQLTSMVFGRFDVASSTNNPAGLIIYSSFHSRRHGASRAAIQHHITNNPHGQKTRNFFANSIQSSSYCRRHHRKDCQRTCCTLAKLQLQQQLALEQKKKLNNSFYLNNSRKPEQKRVAGLVDAIPAFLMCSAMSYRDIAKSMMEKGELKELSDNRILDGWYKLLLEMMTQAIIESYLCDGAAGVDTILDVFSYGDDLDAEEDTNETVVEEGAAGSPSGAENLQSQRTQQQQNISQDIIASDRQDDILFVKTPEYEAFKKAKDERLQEFLTLHGSSMEQHFVKLASKYPLIVFERQMTHYIARSQKLLVDPKLSRSADEIGLLIPPATSAYADGSLSMPVSDGEDDEEMHYSRLEEIKEEEENNIATKIVQDHPRTHQQLLQPQRGRHEKMKLATITTSMDEDDEEQIKPNTKSYNDRAHHLPSPPPSVSVSRSSTVSPSTATMSLLEEEMSIAEAARILMSNKKHRYSETMSEPLVEEKSEPSAEEELRRTVKKIRV